MSKTAVQHIYSDHPLTEEMTPETRTVFLVERRTGNCFAYLCRWPGSPRDREWSVFKHMEDGPDRLMETSRTYEACLMVLGARSPGLLVNFNVWFSDKRMPNF